MTTIQEYIQYTSNPIAVVQSHIVIVARENIVELRCLAKQNRTEIHLSDFIGEEAWLPSPQNIIERLSEQVHKCIDKGQATIVLGLSGYLDLLSEERQERTISHLRQWIDSFPQKNVLWLLEYDEGILRLCHKIFEKPCYKEGMRFFEIGALVNVTLPTAITFITKKWAHLAPKTCKTFHSFLEDREACLASACTEDILIASDEPLAGVRADIRQLTTLHDLAYSLYGIRGDNLSEDAVLWICEQTQQSSGKGLFEELKERFFDRSNILENVLVIFKQFYGVEREVFLWLLPHIVPKESYLEYVLNTKSISVESFVFKYITSAKECLTDYKLYAEERKNAICKGIAGNYNTEIQLFTQYCIEKSTSEVVRWLNCGTLEEKKELLRRCTAGRPVPIAIQDMYPEVKEYLSQNVPWPSLSIQKYFEKYRELKITSHITHKFYEDARSRYIDCAPLSSRDGRIQPFSFDEKCALLVVDAMGVDWLPMLLCIASKQGLKAESVDVCKAHLPTTTAHNPIAWPAERRLPDCKRLDNIAHNGAEPHETRLARENLAVALDAIGQEVVSRIHEGLFQFDYVLVTADHGSSRLAVLAQQGESPLAKTVKLEDGAVSCDWRYRESNRQMACPPECEETLSGNYWVMKGYDRFSKKGGGQAFEVHGGATLEEVLVPVVIFSKRAYLEPLIEPVVVPAQIVEDDDFDI